MKLYYHNVTKGIYNETDLGDLKDNYSDGDTIVSTQSGNAIVTELSKTEVKRLFESLSEEE